ncbi:MAG: cyclase family protein [Thermomicrobiales bacterium]
MAGEEQPSLAALLGAMGGFKVVDLTVTLAEQLPAAWPSHMPFQRKIYNWYAPVPGQAQPVHGFRGPYQTAWITLDEHCGTHIDAPSHFIPPPDSGLANAAEIGSVSVEQLDLAKMMGPAAVIDVTDLNGTTADGISPEITPLRITRWEEEHGPLTAADIVLFRSDWDERFVPFPEGGGYVFDPFIMKHGPGWPTPGIPALQLLLDRGVTTIGLDGVSVGAAHDGVPPHVFGLGRGMMYVELLANLKRLPPRGAFFIFLPLKIEGGSAGPGRAVGLVPTLGGGGRPTAP